MSARTLSKGAAAVVAPLAMVASLVLVSSLAACGGGGGLSIDESKLVQLLTTTVPTGTTGVEYNAQFDARFPNPPGRYMVVGGSLPPGLELDKATGVLSGYPRQVGQFSFTVAARDGIDLSLPPDRDRTFAEDRKSYSLTIARGLPNILPQTLPAAQYRATYGYQIDVAGGTAPYSFQLTGGSLPAGLIVSPTGFVGSFPTQAKQDPYVFQVTVTDANGLQDTETLEVSVVVLPLVIGTPSPLPPGALNFEYTFQLTLASVGAGVPYTWTQVPPVLGEELLSSFGMEITSQGVIRNLAPATGPTVLGLHKFTVQVMDEAGQIATRALQITVNPGPVLTSITPSKAATPGPYNAVGLNFQPGAQLIFKPGPTEVAIVPDYISPTLLRFQNAPPTPVGGGGFVTVRVRNPDAGFYDLPNAFAFPALNLSFDTTPVFPSPQTSLSSTGLDVADVNKDGFADVVHCGTGNDGWGWAGVMGTSGGVDLLINLHPGGTFDGTFTKIQLDTGPEWHQVKFSDVDTDGDLDVVAVGISGGQMVARTWKNPYPAAWTVPGSPSSSVIPGVSPYTIHITDMDLGRLSPGDSVPDLVYAQQDYPSSTPTPGYYYWMYVGGALASVKGAGNGTFSPTIATESGSIDHLVSAAGVAVGPLDLDGSDDVVVGDQVGWDNLYPQAVFALTSPATGVFGAWKHLSRPGSNGYGETLGVAIGDVSGDGRNDVLTATGATESWGPQNGLRSFQGDGSGTFTHVTAQTGSSGALYRYVTTIDADFDIPLDVAATADSGKIDVWKGRTGTSGLQFKQTLELLSDSPDFGRVAGGDFNNDGREDICAALSFLADQVVYTGQDTPNNRGLGGTQGVVIYLNTSQ